MNRLWHHSIICGLLAIGCTFVFVPRAGFAGPLEDGIVAYDRGDFDQAKSLLSPLANGGLARAELYMGLMALGNTEGEGDPVAATRWFRAAAEQGDPEAEYNLGVSLFSGNGAAQDYKSAGEWFEKAARQGHAPAAFDLGAMYEKGTGVPRDESQALHWYTVAANARVPLAMHELADIYHTGRLGKADPVTAYMWLLLAVQYGDSDAKDSVSAFDRPLAPAQIDEAKRRAAAWGREDDRNGHRRRPRISQRD